MKLTSSNGFEYQIDEQDENIVKSRRWCVHLPKKGKYKYVVNVQPKKSPSMVYLHREISGALPGQLVDHINGDTLDNRRQNLRITTQRQNQANQRRVRGAVPYKGVTFEKGKYRARIRRNGKKICLGFHETPEKAAEAYAKSALEVFGEFAFSNYNN